MAEVPEQLKKCTLCKETKSIERFAIRTDKVDKPYRADCMDCYNKRVRDLRATYKEKVFNHYGRECACCGEKEIAFLGIDHINNDAEEDRIRYGWKNKMRGKDLYYKIIEEGFPEGKYQTYCQNCNLGKLICGICPHSTGK